MNSEFGSKKQMVFVETLNFDPNPDQYQVSNWSLLGQRDQVKGEFWWVVRWSAKWWSSPWTWHEWLEMKELKWRIEMKDLKWMTSQEWIEMKQLPKVVYDFYLKSSSGFSLVHILSSFLRPSVLKDFMWSTTWWRCGWHMKPSSRYRVCAPEGVFKRGFTCSRSVTLPNYLNDVFDMMIELRMRLPWWWDS